jgi:hypothetical protein
MRRTGFAIYAALLASMLPVPAFAQFSQARGVGLGVAAGVSVPNGTPDFQSSLNWGFYVDIPLLYTFHITPSTMLYKLRDSAGVGSSATDVSVNFKFIVPLGPVAPFFGVTAGLTSTLSIDPHAGILAGVALRALPNVDLFGQVNYKVILRDGNAGGNVRDLQISAGPLFKFL